MPTCTSYTLHAHTRDIRAPRVTCTGHQPSCHAQGATVTPIGNHVRRLWYTPPVRGRGWLQSSLPPSSVAASRLARRKRVSGPVRCLAECTGGLAPCAYGATPCGQGAWPCRIVQAVSSGSSLPIHLRVCDTLGQRLEPVHPLHPPSPLTRLQAASGTPRRWPRLHVTRANVHVRLTSPATLPGAAVQRRSISAYSCLLTWGLQSGNKLTTQTSRAISASTCNACSHSRHKGQCACGARCGVPWQRRGYTRPRDSTATHARGTVKHADQQEQTYIHTSNKSRSRCAARLETQGGNQGRSTKVSLPRAKPLGHSQL